MDAGDDTPRKVRKERRAIQDLPTRARVWADYVTSGAVMTSRIWGVDRKTIYNIVGECNRDPAFRTMCQDALVKLREDLNERALDAQMVATVALKLRLQDPGHSIPDLLAAVVQLSKVNGNHKGDQSAAAQNAGRGTAIALPFILTTPRADDEPPHADQG
jgi:hypothetical protein